MSDIRARLQKLSREVRIHAAACPLCGELPDGMKRPVSGPVKFIVNTGEAPIDRELCEICGRAPLRFTLHIGDAVVAGADQ